MASPNSFSPVRAILGGLTLSALGAALILAWSSFDHTRTVCEFADTEECNFQQANDEYVSRLQAFGAIGFALMSGGLLLAQRRS